MLHCLSKKFQETAFYLNVTECFLTLLTATGFLMAGAFMTDQSDLQEAMKYVEIGKGFAVVWAGFAIAQGLAYHALLVQSMPTACSSVNVIKEKSRSSRP